MQSVATFPEMARPPVDDFARYLVQLRKAQKLSARALSQKLGLSEAYIHKWEHEERGVSRTVLERVATALSASPRERQELFRLANHREAPESAKHLYKKSTDWLPILLEALLEVEHEALFPKTPDDATTGYGSSFVLAAGTTLSLIVAMSELLDLLPDVYKPQRRALETARETAAVLHPYGKIRWPKSLAKIGIVPKDHDHDALEIPKEVINPQISTRFENVAKIAPAERSELGLSMARIYRAVLFSDAQRARQVAGLIKRWTFKCASDDALQVSIRFRDADLNESYGLDTITWERPYRCFERELSYLLWTTHADQKGAGRDNPWTTAWNDSDWMALMTVVWSLTGLMPEGGDPNQMLRDSLFTIRSSIWPYIQASIRGRFPLPSFSVVTQKEFEASVLGQEVLGRLPAEPWIVASIPRKLLFDHLASVRVVPSFVSEPKAAHPHPRPKGK